MLSAASACATSTTQSALATGNTQAAVAAYEAEQARDLDDLQRIAEHVLIVEARTEDRARSERAWTILRGMGPRAEGVWRELEDEPGEHDGERVRAEALAFRAQLGDATAWRELHALAEDADAAEGAGRDPEVLALAVETLDPERGAESLRAWARSTSASVRSAALEQLASSPVAAETRALLSELARSEPDEGVRIAAIRALAQQGPNASTSLEALARGEPDDDARAAALGALLAVDPLRAEPLCAAVLSDAPSMLGVAVAHDVLTRAQRGQRSDSLEATAEQQILSALAAPNPTLRARAATATLVLAQPPARSAMRQELEQRIGAERDRRVHILLALALRTGPSSKHALEELAEGKDVPAAQAAAELWLANDPKAARRLQELATSTDPSVRATAAAALARGFDFASVRQQPITSAHALLDSDPRVRTTVAAAILRSIERLQAQP